MSKKITCQECNGSGIGPEAMPDDNKACSFCGGSGYREVDDNTEDERIK